MKAAGINNVVVTLLAVCLLLAGRALGQTTQPAKPEITLQEITLQVVTEDRQKLIRATVTSGGKPLENIEVVFAVHRLFGDMVIGKDKTLDDGTAAVPFPTSVPGGSKRELLVAASIASPAPMRVQAVVGGAAPVPVATAESFPRALWAPQAPLALILTIFSILAIVWCTYAYVVLQLLRISRHRGEQ